MSVAAVMLVKDESDILEDTILHTLTQVDRVFVWDNMSTDGTWELLEQLACDEVRVARDPVLGYYQADKMSQFAREAAAVGHGWVVPVDADEMWYANGTTVREFLERQPPEVWIVTATLYDHIPTDRDPAGPPFERIGWRLLEPAPLPKVACRAHPALRIEMGNHGARYGWPVSDTPGLIIRHFPWRGEDRYVRKIRNGEAAYAATDLPDKYGAHWRGWGGQPDEAIRGHYRRWFHRIDPASNLDLIYDPAPTGGAT